MVLAKAGINIIIVQLIIGAGKKKRKYGNMFGMPMVCLCCVFCFISLGKLGLSDV